ncbi:tetratricopeptide repeat protein [Qipengyuania aurantiaca]|uniref:Tetratricopeptide repeat protein n=1 Tax=Qipengyuania aurantiaca TaxID=2867233 RepID=A0ABX8ZJS2_9SPHN|nr:tetratricopeptide repeat protein [Qipengyuania aurantiaca]QZD89169.1 tetratricopeptide repeat protein [Qipengyuania aurantiaca]
MARKPSTELSREEKKAKAEAAEQDALLREVDEAVRQGDFESFMASYGKPLLGLVIVGLVAFGGYLYWDGEREGAMERSGEELVTVLDQIEAGNIDTATGQLDGFDGKGSPAVSAKMLRAGIASEAGENEEAARLYGEIAEDGNAPEALRNLALVRRTTLLFDTMKPEEVVAAMKPLAVPGEPFFTSAGELVAHAYLAQDKRAEAGALFAEIARDENTPEVARARMLNMAGILGVDAVDDVQDVLERQGVEGTDAELVSE